MTEPTDPELLALIEKHLGLKPRRDDTVIDPRTGRFTDVQRYRDFTRAVLAKWGTPPAVAPWRSAVLDLIDDCPGLPLEQDRWLSRRVKELDFASTPQPTQAQAGAVPLTDEQWQRIADLTDSILTRATKDEIERVIGIKGGQHGTD